MELRDDGRRAVGPNSTAMCLDQTLGDVQAEPQPGPFRSRLEASLEAVEYAREPVSGNARPAAGHSDAHSVLVTRDIDFDLGSWIAVFCGIFQQVPEDLLDPTGVGA